MYCQKCGQYNFDYSIYCYNDGMRLLNNSIEMNMSKNKSNYCMSCGQKVETYSNYCQNCGQPMFQVNKKSALVESPQVQNELNKREKLKNVDIKSSLKTASIALFILLIVCAITSLLINEKTNEALAELLELDIDIKAINFLDYALLSHLVKLKYQVSTSYLQNGIADISGGVFATLAIPFVIFLVLGILRAKRDLKEDREFCLMNSFLVGLFYGIGLLILTLFSLIKTEVPVPFTGTILTITKKYSSIAALLRRYIDL